MTLKPSPWQPSYSSKLHKYNNYDKAPYIVSSYPLSPQVIYSPPDQTNSPPLHQHAKEHLLKRTFCKNLTNN